VVPHLVDLRLLSFIEPMNASLERRNHHNDLSLNRSDKPCAVLNGCNSRYFIRQVSLDVLGRKKEVLGPGIFTSAHQSLTIISRKIGNCQAVGTQN
jgi:hypothetical protein